MDAFQNSAKKLNIVTAVSVAAGANVVVHVHVNEGDDVHDENHMMCMM